MSCWYCNEEIENLHMKIPYASCCCFLRPISLSSLQVCLKRSSETGGNDNLGWSDLQMYFKVIKSGTNRKLVYDFLLAVYSNYSNRYVLCRKVQYWVHSVLSRIGYWRHHRRHPAAWCLTTSLRRWYPAAGQHQARERLCCEATVSTLHRWCFTMVRCTTAAAQLG